MRNTDEKRTGREKKLSPFLLGKEEVWPGYVYSHY